MEKKKERRGNSAGGRDGGEKVNWYTIWLRKTGELVASGTGTECARRLGYASRNSFYSVLSHHRKGAGGQKPLRKYDFLVEELTAEGLAQLDRHNKKREPGGVTAPTSPAR